MKVHYKDAKPIRPCQCTAWLVRLPNGQQRIMLWHKDATIEEVHDYCQTRHKEFKLTCIDVGEFIVGKFLDYYLPDARMVDQDWKVQIL